MWRSHLKWMAALTFQLNVVAPRAAGRAKDDVHDD